MNLRNGDNFKAELITNGRTTNKEHSVWLTGVKHDGNIYFTRRNRNGDWFKKCQGKQQSDNQIQIIHKKRNCISGDR